jgi:hypothetical protein
MWVTGDGVKVEPPEVVARISSAKKIWGELFPSTDAETRGAGREYKKIPDMASGTNWK